MRVGRSEGRTRAVPASLVVVVVRKMTVVRRSGAVVGDSRGTQLLEMVEVLGELLSHHEEQKRAHQITAGTWAGNKSDRIQGKRERKSKWKTVAGTGAHSCELQPRMTLETHHDNIAIVWRNGRLLSLIVIPASIAQLPLHQPQHVTRFFPDSLSACVVVNKRVVERTTGHTMTYM